MATFIREFNFWPRCNILGTWYSAKEWQSINDVTYWHENTMGSGPHPIIPANYMAGIVVPFDGFVGEINAWAVPDNNNNSHTEVFLYKYSLLTPGAATRISQPIVVAGGTPPGYIQQTTMVDSSVSKGDCLLLFAKETLVKKAAPHIFGNIVVVDW